jgi:hypothetical protein
MGLNPGTLTRTKARNSPKMKRATHDMMQKTAHMQAVPVPVTIWMSAMLRPPRPGLVLAVLPAHAGTVVNVGRWEQIYSGSAWIRE